MSGVMSVTVIVGMTVAGVVGVAVFMCMSATVAVSTTFGGEGFGHFHHICAKMGKHRLDHVIALDEQAFVFDLAWGVAIANVPGHAIERAGAHFE